MGHSFQGRQVGHSESASCSRDPCALHLPCKPPSHRACLQKASGINHTHMNHRPKSRMDLQALMKRL